MKPKMIPQWGLTVAALLAATALMTGVALARTGGGAMFGTAGNDSLSESLEQLDTTSLSGGHYQLTRTTLGDKLENPALGREVASGGGYHLRVLDSPRLTGNGCCCTYLPCVLR